MLNEAELALALVPGRIWSGDRATRLYVEEVGGGAKDAPRPWRIADLRRYAVMSIQILARLSVRLRVCNVPLFGESRDKSAEQSSPSRTTSYNQAGGVVFWLEQ